MPSPSVASLVKHAISATNCLALDLNAACAGFVSALQLVQNGREVYKWALSTVPEGVEQLLSAIGKSIDGLDWFVPHSAYLRMIEMGLSQTIMA